MAKNNKVIKEQNIDQNLQERYEEMNDFLLDLIEDHKRAEEDLKYLKDFVVSPQPQVPYHNTIFLR